MLNWESLTPFTASPQNVPAEGLSARAGLLSERFMKSGVTMSWLDWPSSACTTQNISRLPGAPFLWICTCETRILSSGSEQAVEAPGSLNPTPEVYMVCVSLSKLVSAIGLAGTDEAPVHEGEKAHDGHIPQSAGQVTQFSGAVQVLSPHIG